MTAPALEILGTWRAPRPEDSWSLVLSPYVGNLTRPDVVARRADGAHFILTGDRTRVLGGPYPSRKVADARLREIAFYKDRGDADLVTRARTARVDGFGRAAVTRPRPVLRPHPTRPGETRAHATARAVHMHKVTARAPLRRRRIPPQKYPLKIEGAYAKALRGFVGRVRDALAPLRDQLDSLLEQARAERGDAATWRLDASGASKRLDKIIEQARATVEKMSAPRDVENLARDFAAQTGTYQRVQLGRQVKAALGIDVVGNDKRLPAIVDAFVAENVNLITSIPQVLLSQVEGTVRRAVTEGRTREALQAEIAQRFGVSDARAKLIARDQIGKLYGGINASRQKELGVTRFTWRTVADERVRDEHRVLDGQVFPYDQPPSEGLPGYPIQCRCSAEPDFSSIAALTEDPNQPAPEPAPEQTVASGGAGGPVGEEIPIWEKPKNPKRVAAARLAGQASAERTREIYGAVKTNLSDELQVAWDKEGHKFLREESARIKGVKDRINAASKISEAFAETYGSGEAGSYEGDRFAKRLEIEAAHGEQWADEQTAAYYAKLEAEAAEAGYVGGDGEPSNAGLADEEFAGYEATTPGTLDEDPPF